MAGDDLVRCFSRVHLLQVQHEIFNLQAVAEAELEVVLVALIEFNARLAFAAGVPVYMGYECLTLFFVLEL